MHLLALASLALFMSLDLIYSEALLKFSCDYVTRFFFVLAPDTVSSVPHDTSCSLSGCACPRARDSPWKAPRGETVDGARLLLQSSLHSPLPSRGRVGLQQHLFCCQPYGKQSL